MGHNAKTRALVSALRSGIPTLRAAACHYIDDVVEGAEYPAKAVMAKLRASKPTAYGLLRERAKYDKRGRPR